MAGDHYGDYWKGAFSDDRSRILIAMKALDRPCARYYATVAAVLVRFPRLCQTSLAAPVVHVSVTPVNLALRAGYLRRQA